MKHKMNFPAMLFASIAAAAFSVSGATYYVDANIGDDLRDGSSPEMGEGNVGPRKTLVGVMELVSNNDVVYAAPGRYEERDSGGYRVKIPEGVSLIASGAKEETFIFGAAAPDTATDRDESGNGTGAIRCAYLSKNTRLVGFTLTDGHTTAGEKSSGGAVNGNSNENSAVMDCIVSNNFAVYRGGAFAYVTSAVRCFFADNKCGYAGQSMLGGAAYNCVFAQSSGYHVQAGGIYNCTFLSNGSNCKNSTLYNSILLKKDSGDNKLYKCIYVEKAGGSTYDTDCIQITSDEASSFLDATWRPLKASAAIDAGDPDYYDNNFPTALAAEKDKTMLGSRFVDNIDIGAIEYGQVYWYVDPENGKDNYKGNDRSYPMKTLSAVMEYACEGDVVHAARGVYDEGEMEANGMANRVCVKAGVGLVADEGPEVTAIKGKRASSENGIGTDAVRCVSLADNAWIQGFTITNGFTATTGEYESSYGGGVYAATSSAMIDCVIAGNGCGYRGASTYRGTCIRCLFHGASAAGNFSAWKMAALVNCVFMDGANCYGDGTVSVALNCLMAGGSTYGSKTLLCNSYIKTTGRKAVAGITNCVLGVTEGYIDDMPYDPETCKYSVGYDNLKLDENYRPALDSVLVDFASKELYDAYFPEAWERFKDVDFSGGQRIYNGNMDVGAGECDWRAKFSAELNLAGRTAVVRASENVTTNAAGGIRLAGGDSVEVAYSPSADGKCAFCVSSAGDGEVLAKLGDETLVPDERGVYYYVGGVDGNHIAVSYTGEGYAVISKFAGPLRGLSITLR